MIKLDVKDYCQSCSEFSPDVEMPVTLYSNGETYMTTGDTIIRCEHRRHCEHVKRQCCVKEEYLRGLYEKYKHDWCDARGYKLEEMDEEFGINGECYACFEEWYWNEYHQEKKDQSKPRLT